MSRLLLGRIVEGLSQSQLHVSKVVHSILQLIEGLMNGLLLIGVLPSP